MGHVQLEIDSVVKEALRKYDNLKKVAIGGLECDVCKLIFETIQKLFGDGMSWNSIADAVGDMCYLFKVEDKNVCSKIAHEFQVKKPIITNYLCFVVCVYYTISTLEYI